MSDPREPSDPESTENTPAPPAEPTPDEPTPAAPSTPSAPPFPGGTPAAPSAPSTPPAPPTPPTPSFAPPTAPLPPASSSLPPVQTPPTAPPAPSAPSYGPPSGGASSPAPSYGAPPVYGTPASTGPSAPTPSYGSPYGSGPTPAGAPPAGGLPYTTPYAPGQIPPRNKGGWMGILSIVLGGLALFVCWIPFLNYLTVFGAIAGLVFGLIALFRKFGSRALSLTGTIVSGVAFLLTVVFIVIYTLAFFTADSGPDYTDTPYTSSPSDDPSESDSPDEPTAAPGDPTIVPGDATPSAGATVCADGTAIAVGKAGILTYDGENQAEVTIEDVQLDATDTVLAENSLNETPPDGYQYALISLTIKQLGTESFPAGASRGIFKGVAEDIASPADYAVLPEPELLFAPDLSPGDSVTGNIAVFVPTSGADSGSLLVDNYFTDNTCELKVG